MVEAGRSALNVVVLPRHSSLAATARLRGYAFEDAFQSVGRTVFCPLFTDGHVRRLSRPRTPWLRLVNILSASVAYLKRIALLVTFRYRFGSRAVLVIMQEALPFIPRWLEMRLLDIACPAFIVVDLDDAYHEVYRGLKNRLLRKALCGKFECLWNRSDLVFAGSPILRTEVMRYTGPNTRVVYIPTVVDIQRYSARNHDVMLSGPLVVGWIGSPSTTRHVIDILPLLEKAAEAVPLKLVLVGATPVQSEKIEIIQHPWELETEANIVASFDIGIMPLDDNPFTRGKCGYKLIQYMAAAVPVIASDVGVNHYIVVGNEEPCGLMVEGHADWTEAVLTLAQNSELRSRFGKAGRRRVENAFCTRVVAPLIGQELGRLAHRS